MEWVIFFMLGLPLIIACALFVVLACWLQVRDEVQEEQIVEEPTPAPVHRRRAARALAAQPPVHRRRAARMLQTQENAA